jgi:hypothetical protein
MSFYNEIYDGDNPPAKDAWKTASAPPKEAPPIDDLLKGANTGAANDLVKRIEIEDLTDQLAPGATYAPVKKDSESQQIDDLFKKFILNPDDQRTCKCSCGKCFIGKCMECRAEKKCATFMAGQAAEDKSAKMAKMMKYDRGVSPIVERAKAKLGTFDSLDDEYWQTLIDHCTEYVAETVEHAHSI